MKFEPLMTEHEYTFLKGDHGAWAIRGAAFNCVAEYCQEFGWGTFGQPTELGRKAMKKHSHEEEDWLQGATFP